MMGWFPVAAGAGAARGGFGAIGGFLMVRESLLIFNGLGLGPWIWI